MAADQKQVRVASMGEVVENGELLKGEGGWEWRERLPRRGKGFGGDRPQRGGLGGGHPPYGGALQPPFLCKVASEQSCSFFFRSFLISFFSRLGGVCAALPRL